MKILEPSFISLFILSLEFPAANVLMYSLKIKCFPSTEPNFVGSYDVGEYVYFFFRETAVEYINCGKNVYSRFVLVASY